MQTAFQFDLIVIVIIVMFAAGIVLRDGAIILASGALLSGYMYGYTENHMYLGLAGVLIAITAVGMILS